MNEHIQSKMADPTRDFHLPRYQEIPDVGLYLEQTAKYIDSYLSPLEDISITGSMISNYVKKKIINNPVKKQYNRDPVSYTHLDVYKRQLLMLPPPAPPPIFYR